MQENHSLLAGINFYRKAIELISEHNNRHIEVENTVQTNATLIDEESV